MVAVTEWRVDPVIQTYQWKLNDLVMVIRAVDIAYARKMALMKLRGQGQLTFEQFIHDVEPEIVDHAAGSIGEVLLDECNSKSEEWSRSPQHDSRPAYNMPDYKQQVSDLKNRLLAAHVQIHNLQADKNDLTKSLERACQLLESLKVHLSQLMGYWLRGRPTCPACQALNAKEQEEMDRSQAEFDAMVGASEAVDDQQQQVEMEVEHDAQMEFKDSNGGSDQE